MSIFSYKYFLLIGFLIGIAPNWSYSQNFNERKVEKRLKKKFLKISKEGRPFEVSRLQNVKSANLTEWTIDSSQTIVAIYQYDSIEDAKVALKKQLMKVSVGVPEISLNLGDENYLFKSKVSNRGMLLIRKGLLLIQMNTNDVNTSIDLAKILLKEVQNDK